MIRSAHFLGIMALALMAGVSFVCAQQTVSVEEKCVYLDTPVIEGETNDPKAVVLVQHFLRTYEHFPIDITGTYDDKTQQAVCEFQRRYAMDILTPWGLAEPTGNVSVTTLHKINEICCGAGAFLSSQEEKQIRAIQEKYSVADSEKIIATTTPLISDIIEGQNGRLTGTTIGFISEFSLPILITLFVLMVTQTYFMWKFIERPKMRLSPRKIKRSRRQF
ncbi:MAG: peptidoglycan-binding protein [Candidatus Pacebacteria bacterium]|nr:peptidoglycan-binding protein [Candidatus Paceibacterota bacterium]